MIAQDKESPDFRHKHEGGTFVTNFNVRQRPAYDAAVKEYNDPRFIIKDDAFDSRHRPIEFCNALHITGDEFPDTGDFFALMKKHCEVMGISMF